MAAYDYDQDEAPLPKLEPAALGPRIAAGAIDLFAVIVLTTVFFAIPLSVGGAVMPLLCAFAAVLGWVVVPVWLFQATVGMRLMKVELTKLDGQPLDPAEVLFREMIGRGFLGVIYLSTLLVGVVGMLTGRLMFSMPVGPGLLLFFIAVVLVGVAGVGHFIALSRPDRRGLADLWSHSMVIPRRPTAEALDADDKLELEHRKARHLRNFIVFEVVLFFLVAGGPLLFPYLYQAAIGPSDMGHLERKVKTQNLEAQFNADPMNDEVAYELELALAAEGKEEKAAAVRKKHQEVRAAANATVEQSLKERLKANPKDEEALSRLLEVYADAGRKEDAKGAYAAYVEADPTPDNKVGFGVWLYDHDFNEEAVKLLEANAGAVDVPSAWAYLGWAYQELGRKKDAQRALKRALEGDPEMDQVRFDLEALDEELGPIPDPKPVKKAGGPKRPAR